MRKSQIPILALLALLVSFVRALFRYHWVRWVSLPRSLRGPRIFTCRIANAFQVFIGPLWISVPMPWSRVMLDSYARSSPWLLPEKSGIRTALGFCLLLALAVSAAAQPPMVLERDSVLRIAWDAPDVDPDNANALTGYTAEIFNPDNPTQVHSSQNTVGTETAMDLLTNALPVYPQTFMLAVRAFDSTGLTSGRSNAIGPFAVRRPKVAPGVPTNLRFTVGQ